MIRGLVTPNIAECESFELNLEPWFQQAGTNDLVAFAAMDWNTDHPLGISTLSAVSATVEILRFYETAGNDQCAAVLRAHKARKERREAVDMNALPAVRAHGGDAGFWIREERPDLIEAVRKWVGNPEFVGGVATILLCAGGPYGGPVPWVRPGQATARLDEVPARERASRPR